MSFLLNKEKTRVTLIIVLLILSSVMLLVTSFLTYFIIMLSVYFTFYLIYLGFSILFGNIGRNKLHLFIRMAKILLSAILITFGVLILYLFIKSAVFTYKKIIVLMAYPIMMIGFCGIVKGSVVKVYMNKFRILNIVLGMITIIYCIYAIQFPNEMFAVHIILLCVLLFVNWILRLGLYLSEFELSLKSVKNIKIALFIRSNPPLKTKLLKQKISTINT